MRWSAVNRAAATSGRKARRLRAKPYATTPIIPTWLRGSSRAWANDPRCTRNPSSSRKCIRCSVRTSNEASPETSDEGPSEASLLGNPMRFNLRIWRQTGPATSGRLVDYVADSISPDMSFLEMLDVVNEGLVAKGKDAIAFDSDCR